MIRTRCESIKSFFFSPKKSNFLLVSLDAEYNVNDRSWWFAILAGIVRDISTSILPLRVSKRKTILRRSVTKEKDRHIRYEILYEKNKAVSWGIIFSSTGDWCYNNLIFKSYVLTRNYIRFQCLTTSFVHSGWSTFFIAYPTVTEVSHFHSFLFYQTVLYFLYLILKLYNYYKR